MPGLARIHLAITPSPDEKSGLKPGVPALLQPVGSRHRVTRLSRLPPAWAASL
jgi:hypothetical protein